MSKLVEKLQRISRLTQPIGFKPAQDLPSQPMLIIAALPQGDTNRVAEIVNAEIDAIAVHMEDSISVTQSFQQAVRDAKEIPIGVWIDAMNKEDFGQIAGTEYDFVIFEAAKAPAMLLQEERIGKVLKVDTSWDDSLIKTIERLPIEAVVIGEKDETSPTVYGLMCYHWFASATSKPLLAIAHLNLVNSEIQALQEAGVSGVIVEVKGEQPGERLLKLRQTIKTLPPAKRSRERREALLPRLRQETNYSG